MWFLVSSICGEILWEIICFIFFLSFFWLGDLVISSVQEGKQNARFEFCLFSFFMFIYLLIYLLFFKKLFFSRGLVNFSTYTS